MSTEQNPINGAQASVIYAEGYFSYVAGDKPERRLGEKGPFTDGN